MTVMPSLNPRNLAWLHQFRFFDRFVSLLAKHLSEQFFLFLKYFRAPSTSIISPFIIKIILNIIFINLNPTIPVQIKQNQRKH